MTSDKTPVPEAALLHRSLNTRPCKVSHASGSYLYLEDGRKILDACGGAAVTAIGHSNQEVTEAAVAQMQKVSYVHTGNYTTDSAEDLASAILTPRNCSYDHGLVRAYFVGSGSEATDAAMKFARQYWFEQGQTQRRVFISRKQSYHGCTLGALSLSAHTARKKPFQEISLDCVANVGPAYAYRYQKADESEGDYAERLVDELEAEMVSQGPENVISFSAEPMVGATSGCVAAPKGYWPGVRKVCDKYGVLLHVDEIMCGTGRLGAYFAFEQEGIKPDLVTLGKGLGGGYSPIAAMLVSRKVVDALQQGSAAFVHGHTYQAHPVSCATALAVQKILRRDRLIERCGVQGKKLGGMLRDTFRDCKYVGDVRGAGLFWALEFVRDRGTKEAFGRSAGFAEGVQAAAFELGVAVYPGVGTADGVVGDHVIIAPPYNVSDEELDVAVSTLRKAYDEQEALVG